MLTPKRFNIDDWLADFIKFISDEVGISESKLVRLHLYCSMGAVTAEIMGKKWKYDPAYMVKHLKKHRRTESFNEAIDNLLHKVKLECKKMSIDRYAHDF